VVSGSENGEPAVLTGCAEVPPLILASGSATRRSMLAAAGVPIEGHRLPLVDEAPLRTQYEADGVTAEQAADLLALAKAQDVAVREPAALVLGADQILATADGTWLGKPADQAAARDQLRALRGTRHRLVTAAVLVQDGCVVWRDVDVATLTMRDFSDPFLETYLEAVGSAVRTSVGGYQVEGLGLHLFSEIAGDHFTILGLPLLPLLKALREQGILPI